MKPIIAARDEAVAGRAAPTASVRWALASLSLSMLLSSLGTSIANVGLPTLAQAFGASFQEVQWVVLAYLLAITTLIVSVGRLGDITGRRRLLLAGIVLFTRGLGPVRRRAHALAADRRPGGAGPRRGHHDGPHHGLCRRDGTEGQDRQRHGAARNDVRDRHRARPVARRRSDRRPRLAGDLPRQRAAGHPDLRSRPSPPARRSSGPKADRAGFDPVGTLLLALTLAAYALAMTVTNAGRGSFGPLNLALLPASVLGAGLFVLAEARTASPLIRLAMFRVPVLSASLATSALVSTVIMATMVVGPFYLSRALGLDAARVGLVLAVGPIVVALTAAPAGRVADRFGARRMTTVGLIGMAAGSSMLSMLRRRWASPATSPPSSSSLPAMRCSRQRTTPPSWPTSARTSAVSSPACSTCRATWAHHRRIGHGRRVRIRIGGDRRHDRTPQVGCHRHADDVRSQRRP